MSNRTAEQKINWDYAWHNWNKLRLWMAELKLTDVTEFMSGITLIWYGRTEVIWQKVLSGKTDVLSGMNESNISFFLKVISDRTEINRGYIWHNWGSIWQNWN